MGVGEADPPPTIGFWFPCSSANGLWGGLDSQAGVGASGEKQLRLRGVEAEARHGLVAAPLVVDE